MDNNNLAAINTQGCSLAPAFVAVVPVYICLTGTQGAGPSKIGAVLPTGMYSTMRCRVLAKIADAGSTSWQPESACAGLQAQYVVSFLLRFPPAPLFSCLLFPSRNKERRNLSTNIFELNLARSRYIYGVNNVRNFY